MTQYRHIFNSNTFAEVKYTGWWGFYDLNPTNDVPRHIRRATGLHTGSQGWFYYADRTRDQVNANVTHYADKFGRHELKFGAEFEHSTMRDRYGYPAASYFYDYGGVPYLRLQLQLRHLGAEQPAVGVRAGCVARRQPPDHQRRRARRHAPGLAARAAATSTTSNNWAPRLGAAFDLAGDNRTVIKGSYGMLLRRVAGAVVHTSAARDEDYVTYLVNADGSLGDDQRRQASRSVQGRGRYQAIRGWTRRRSASNGRSTGTMRLSLTGIWRDNKNFVNSVAPSARWKPVTLDHGSGQHDQTFYSWANRAASNTDYLIRNVKGFQYRSPDGHDHRHGRSVPAIPGVHGGAEQALHEPLAGADLVRATRKPPATSTTRARHRSRPASSRRPTWRWSTRRGRRATRRPTSSSCWEATRSRGSKPRSARILRATSGLPYDRIQQFPTATLNTSGLIVHVSAASTSTPRGSVLPADSSTSSTCGLRRTSTSRRTTGSASTWTSRTSPTSARSRTSITRPQSVTLLDSSVVPAAVRHAGEASRIRVRFASALAGRSSELAAKGTDRRARVALPAGPVLCSGKSLPIRRSTKARISTVERPPRPPGASRERSWSCGA